MDLGSMSPVDFWNLVEKTFSSEPQIIQLMKNQLGLDDKFLAINMAAKIKSIRTKQGLFALEVLFEAANKTL